MPPPSTIDWFIRFGTDAAGLDRLLRMVQAFLMLITSLPLLQTGLIDLIALGNGHIWDEPRVVDIGALGALRGQVSFARRLFRMFRFLESFQAANKLYATFYSQPPGPSQPPSAAQVPSGTPDPAQAKEDKDASSAPEPARADPDARQQRRRRQQPPAEAWLDILGRTFNGMYLLLETLTLLDSLQQPGLSPWGPTWYRTLHVEGQRFWFLALALGVASGLTKIIKLFAYAPVPPTGEGYGYGTGGGERDESLMADWERERERLRRIVWRRREQRKLWRANIRGRLRGLVRRCVADFLDLAIPGSVLGWVRVAPGTLGALMVVTTYLTGIEIWERCGRDVSRV
ncbi:hypothetical protein SLS53_001629 [Cytospora paraplurivora]|uniref:Uncharacterized protein n=1 Tax=Cytospora paraplurivora TaxID=2898453 RepID=A0AAN9UG57_9PEZI